MKNVLGIFLKLIQSRPFMDCIVNEDGKEIEDPQKISSDVYYFYDELFEDQNIQIGKCIPSFSE